MAPKKRQASWARKTHETIIAVKLNVDGSGKASVNTGIAFLDHMLDCFARHGLFDITLNAQGDLEVDIHHTNEDVGIALGRAFKMALGDKRGIRRFGDFRAPLDEALSGVRVSLDLSGRGSFHLHTSKKTAWAASPAQCSKTNTVGYSLGDAKHWLESFASTMGANLHVDLVAGENTHHMIESIFKALAKALGDATRVDTRVKGVPSTKGRL
jgi:imidazoleglycerol-phosphate dehydratase